MTTPANRNSERDDAMSVLVEALEAFAAAIEVAGGICYSDTGIPDLVCDPAWSDLGYAYLGACIALGRTPMATVQGEEAAEKVEDEELAEAVEEDTPLTLPLEPEEGDLVTDDRVRFYEVGRNWGPFHKAQRPTLAITDRQDWRQVVREHQDQEQLWGNVWEYTPDSGYQLLDLTGD